MNLPEFSVKKKVTVTMLTLIILLGGVVAFFGLGLDLMPDMEFPMISVVTKYPGVAPEDIETMITKPIEEACSSLKGLKNIYSTSMEGSSVVMVEFEWGTNLDFAAQDARENIDMMRVLLPTEADNSMVLKFDMSQMPVIFYGVTGMKDTMELRQYLKDNLAPHLERLDGVASVLVLGGREREIHVSVDRTKLQAYGISLETVKNVIGMENVNTSAGNITSKYTEYFVRTTGEYKSIYAIKNTVLKKVGDVPIYVKDVASVEDSFKEKRDITRLNGRPAVLMSASKQSGANTVKTIDGLKKELKRMKPLMPADLEFYPVLDQGHIIKKILSKTLVNGLVGGVLAVFFLFAFLRNWRPTAGIAIAIPISVIATFIGLYLMGYTFNIFTLAGFALVVGMLVDNAVVVIENIFRHLEEGGKRGEAAAKGAGEVAGAIATSTFTTIAVFLPMVLSKGFAGQITRPLAMTVCTGLLASLFVALTIVPMLASVLFQEKREASGKANEKKGMIDRMKDVYASMLNKALRKKKRVLFGAMAIFVLSLALLKVTGFEFMPPNDVPVITLNGTLPVGTDLQETARVAGSIGKDFMALPEKKYVLEMIGRSEYGDTDAAYGTMPADVNGFMIMSRMTDLEKRKRKVQEISDTLRREFPPLKGADYTFSDMSSSMSGEMSRSPVEIKLFGDDLQKLDMYAKEVVRNIKNVKGLRDLKISLERGKPELQINIDRARAAHFGLRAGMLGKAVQNAFTGVVAGKYRVGGDETDIRVRFNKDDRATIRDIENLPIPLGGQSVIELKDVAAIHHGFGPLKIDRENRMRKISVTANVKNRAIGKVISDVKKKMSRLKFPMGYFVEYGGTYDQMKSTMRDLALAFLAALILIYMIMAAQFESLTQPFVIMFSVPMSLIGVMIGLTIMGMSFSVPAMMGVIILAGIVVNNGIVMVDYVNRLRNSGVEKYEAIVRGAVIRLRPILITALTTILGILPMAFSHSQGAEIRAPLGVAVAFGLMSATFLTLFVVPVLYAVADRVARKSSAKISKSLHGE